jgi:hypothetical protein
LTTSSETSIGGGGFVPVAGPIHINIFIRASDGSTSAVPADLAATTIVDVTLPIISPPAGASPGGTFVWLQAVYANGIFLGYVRPATDFNPATGDLTLHLPISSLQGVLLLPALIVPAAVQNFDLDTHIFSSWAEDAQDFGSAGSQFTTFTVVGPQVAGRVPVYNPVSGNYGWLDVGDVGPSGVPAE